MSENSILLIRREMRSGLTGAGHKVNATMLRLLDPFRFVLIAVSSPMDNRQSLLIDPARS